MDIEEERKAFEEKAYPNASTVDFDGEKYSPRFNSEWQRVVSEHANRMFPVWLAAKEHAVEMAKLTVVIRESHYGWSVYLSNDGIFNGIIKDEMASGEEAAAWAEDNGYRVVE